MYNSFRDINIPGDLPNQIFHGIVPHLLAQSLQKIEANTMPVKVSIRSHEVRLDGAVVGGECGLVADADCGGIDLGVKNSAAGVHAVGWDDLFAAVEVGGGVVQRSAEVIAVHHPPCQGERTSEKICGDIDTPSADQAANQRTGNARRFAVEFDYDRFKYVDKKAKFLPGFLKRGDRAGAASTEEKIRTFDYVAGGETMLNHFVDEGIGSHVQQIEIRADCDHVVAPSFEEIRHGFLVRPHALRFVAGAKHQVRWGIERNGDDGFGLGVGQ